MAEQIIFESLYDRAGTRNGPDYVRELEARVRFLESNLETARLEIGRLARDPLTGAWGRARLDDLLGLALARGRRQREGTADGREGRRSGGDRRRMGPGVLFIDVDGLKPLNDIDGHPAGDEALREAVRAIHSCLRATDSLIRYGGDEFVVIVDDTTVQALQALGRRIVDAVAFHSPVSVSVGGAVHEPDENGLALIKRADGQCYRAKMYGGNVAVTSVGVN